jgi:intracellular multiplication protein IcmB
MGLKVEDIIRSRISKNAPLPFRTKFPCDENRSSCTCQGDDEGRDGEKARKRKALKSNQIPQYGQDLDTIYESLRTLHITNVDRVIDNFRLCDKSGTSVLCCADSMFMRRPEAFA